LNNQPIDPNPSLTPHSGPNSQPTTQPLAESFAPAHLTQAHLTQDHLTPDQFAAFALAGSPDPSAVHAVAVDLEAGVDPAGLAHLAACAVCREDLARFSDSLASFNTLSLAWAESRPARPIVVHPTLLRRLRRPFLHPAAWAFAACLLILSLFALSPRLNRDEPEVASALHQSSTTDSPAEIARDNRLMDQVTLEINRPVPSPAAEYGIAADPDASSHPSRQHPSFSQKTPAESRID